MGNTYFEFKKFRVYQDQCAFKVTTDSCILGAFTEVGHPSRICDMGSGTGILSLMMAQKYPSARIDAVEIDGLSADQARENVRSSPWKGRIMIYTDRIQNFSTSHKKNYDLLICNPPYFEDHLQSSDFRKSQARHTITLTLQELASSADKLLIDDGCFYTILPPVSYEKLHAHMRMIGFELKKRLDIYVRPGKPLHRIVGTFARKYSRPEHDHIYIFDHEGNYTNTFKTYLKEFYLAF